MDSKSRMVSLVLLGITALSASRGMFWFFDDPEGPNLLIVAVTAAVVYVISLGIVSAFSVAGIRKVLLTICIQILIVGVLYLFLN